MDRIGQGSGEVDLEAYIHGEQPGIEGHDPGSSPQNTDPPSAVGQHVQGEHMLPDSWWAGLGA